MITSLSLGINGRLGNQLFQYAALRALGLKNNYEVKIPQPESRAWHGQECLLNYLNIEAEYLSKDDMLKLKHRYLEPNYMVYDAEFFDTPDFSTLDGYFQSTYYFDEFEDQIKKELTPNADLLAESKEYVDKIRKDNHAEVVSVHLRRGDNTDGSNPSKLLCNMYGDNNKHDANSFYGRYLRDAKKIFQGKEVVFLMFSGGARGKEDNRSDLDWCRANFKDQGFIIAEPASPIQDFSRIMSCDHNIISHVSSYGWWAAYLNQSPQKTVVAPFNYHPDRPNYSHRKGFFPKEFVLV
tara:strand:+ start:399 stop:1283 length:885 start_codon:yes stop_codon:yes gene_type:complete